MPWIGAVPTSASCGVLFSSSKQTYQVLDVEFGITTRQPRTLLAKPRLQYACHTTVTLRIRCRFPHVMGVQLAQIHVLFDFLQDK